MIFEDEEEYDDDWSLNVPELIEHARSCSIKASNVVQD
jgi:hypothetical protein